MIIKKLNINLALLVLMIVSCNSAFSQEDSLKAGVEKIINESGCSVGAAIKELESGKTYLFNNDANYPMQSVFKFPLAMAVLDRVDKREISLDKIIKVTKQELLPKTWSPLREKYPEGADLKLSEILSYTVSQSDNTGCDILFSLIGGPLEAEKYIRGLGITDLSIKNTEEEMHKDAYLQFVNSCKPSAMAELLGVLSSGTALSRESNDFLLKIMTETATGPKRIKGLLPEGTIVAHKTGSSGKSDDGITAACNDAGIVTLPDGRHIAIVVFVSMSKESDEFNDSIIARISKLAIDYFISLK